MCYGYLIVFIDDIVFFWGGWNDIEGVCNVLYVFDVNIYKWFIF